MKLTVLGSSSAGNCYLLSSQTGETLVIECGIRFEKIKRALDFNLACVSGVIVTHEHGDHGKAAKDVLSAGLKLFCTAGTAGALDIATHYNCRVMVPRKAYMIGPFKVMPFKIEHDVAEPVGFIIYHPECGNVLFLTDTCFAFYRFPGMNNLIVEANYCQDILDRKTAEGKVHGFLRKRIMESHMSINTCRDMLVSNDLSQVNNIVLIHLSDSNSNAVEFEQKIRNATGKTVTIAAPGVVIENFNINPF